MDRLGGRAGTGDARSLRPVFRNAVPPIAVNPALAVARRNRPPPTAGDAAPPFFLQLRAGHGVLGSAAGRTSAGHLKTTNTMKHPLRSFLLAAACAAGLALATTLACAAEPGYVDFGPALAGISSTKCVEVNLPEPLLAFAATLAKGKDADAAALIKDLRQVRVNVLGLDEKNRGELTAHMQKIRADLAAQGWLRAVTVQDNGDDVSVLVKLGADSAVEGLTVTVLSKSNDAVFVNIVGNIDPARIAAIGERYGIDHLKQIHCKPAGAPCAPAAPAAPATADTAAKG